MEIYGRVRRAVLVEGKSERAVAQEFGIARETVRKMLRYSVPPGYRLLIENALVGPRGPKIAVGIIEEVSVRCWGDDDYTASACSSVCESAC